MRATRREALCANSIVDLGDDGMASGYAHSADIGFRDRTWTLPRRIDVANALTIAMPQGDDIVITHVVRRDPGHGMTEPQATAKAYSARVYLEAFDCCDVWRDGKPVRLDALKRGEMQIDDMRHEWRANPTSPFNIINFFIPQAAIDEIAEEQGAHRGVALRGPTEAGWTDILFGDLARSLLPALAAPEQANKLFTDHLTRAAVAHLTASYGSLRLKLEPTRSGLAPWQERRVKEMMMADLARNIGLAELAMACRLSPSYFSTAFKRSVGYPPYKWLLMKRLERVQDLILNTKQPLCEIALDTGFADQSHLTRIFSQHIGSSPGAWRRARAA